MDREDMYAYVCTNINTLQFIHWVLLQLVANTAARRHAHADTCSVHSVQVVHRR